MMLLLLLGTTDLQLIEDAYVESEFEQVSALVQRQENKPLTVQQRKRVYELGGFAELFLGREQRAAMYFQKMFALDANASIDERRYPPRAVAFYKQQRPKPQMVVTESPPSPQRGEKKRGFNPVTLIPLGVGHLLVGDYPAGIAFLATEAALIATSISLYYVRQSKRLPGDAYANPNEARTMQIVQNVAAFAAIGVGIYSVIDCLLFAEDRVAARKARVSVVPMGGGASFSIQY